MQSAAPDTPGAIGALLAHPLTIRVFVLLIDRHSSVFTRVTIFAAIFSRMSPAAGGCSVWEEKLHNKGPQS